MTEPGPHNGLCDIPGIAIGHAHDARVRSGVTVLRFEAPMRCAADVRGGGPATRETPAVGTDATLGIAHALTLSGGSVFGLAAADAVAAALSAQGVGYRPGASGTPPVPIVPGAALYDLGNGGGKDWSAEPPYGRLAAEALAATGQDATCGSVGAGYGAVAGAWRGGLGTASIDLGGGVCVAAMVAANPIGSPVMPGGEAFWAWPFEIGGEFGGLRPSGQERAANPLPADLKAGLADPATCIGAVAASVPLDRASLRRVAVMAQDGLARAIRPSHAPLDGDTLFAVCPDAPAETTPPEAMRLGAAAADCISRAVARGVWHANDDWDDVPAFRGPSV